MNISMDLLYEKLKEHYPVRRCGCPEDASFGSFLYYHNADLKGGRLYLITGEQFRSLGPAGAGRLFLCLDDLGEEDIPAGSALIYGPLREQADELVEEITDLLDSFQNWESGLNGCSFDLPGIRKMLDLSGEYLGGALLLSDRSFNLIAYTKDHRVAEHGNFVTSVRSARLSDSAVQTMLSDPDFNMIARKRDPFLYHYVGDELQNKVLCYNLFRSGDDSFSGRLILHTFSETYAAGQHFMIRYLGERLEKIYNIISDFSLPLSPYTSLRVALGGMTANEKTDPERLHAILNDVSWEADDTYIMIYLSPELRSREQPLHKLIGDRLELLYHEACALISDSEGYLLVNMTRCGCRTAHDVQQKLPDVLREHLLKAGLSNVFHDFSKAGTAALEAKAAVMAGNTRHSTYWYYHFDQYVVDYLLIGNPLHLPMSSLIHPAFGLLETYDRQRGTELLRTLNVFIACRYNMTHCAEQLYTHRSTLQRHIDKIVALTGVSFDSEDTRFHLLYSYLVWERQGHPVAHPDSGRL
ncbi:MAG: helix-turn-helix domain-containing protein [Lachnospiraceae bacterium]|nr:helix-turn-helix domain-containing protein [Lachnospiraceae bacterium]MBQ1515484.1 helix-turn-helix domain-containing protein [Lachnospiraceae bacterium]